MNNCDKIQLIKHFIERKRLDCIKLERTAGLDICDSLLNFINSLSETVNRNKGKYDVFKSDRVLNKLKEILKKEHTVQELTKITNLARSTIRRRLTTDIFKYRFKKVNGRKKVKVWQVK